MYFLIDLIRETAAIFLNVAPFLLFGFLLAGILHVLVPAEWLRARLGRRGFRSVAFASLVGVPLPLCSCSVLPVAASLRKSGASKGAVTALAISTPETDIDTIFVTYALMDPIMTVTRPLAAVGTSLAAGMAVDLFDRGPGTSVEGDGPAETPDSAAPAGDADSCACGPPEPVPAGGKLRAIFDFAYCELLDDIAPWLVIGIALSGLIGALLPAGALQNPALRGLPSMLLMLVIGIPLYVCATSSTPLAAMLIQKGLSPGAALVFMLSGPATNATTITVLTKLLGKRAIAIYIGCIAVFSLLAGFAVDAIYASSGIAPRALTGAFGEIVPIWLRAAAALVLAALLLRSAARLDLATRWRQGLARLGRPVGVDLGGRAARRCYAAVLVVLYLLTGWSVVEPGEVGWVLSFGRITRAVATPGLVIHWPYPFERLERESADLVRSLDRGFRPGQPFGAGATGAGSAGTVPAAPGAPARGTVPTGGGGAPAEIAAPADVAAPADERELTREAEVATGDENLVSIRYSVQYRVADPRTYHFGLDEPEQIVTGFAEYAIRRVMGTAETDTILVQNRMALSTRTAEVLREELAAIDAGVEVLRVDLLDVHAPTDVHYSFRDVASAMEDKHRFIRQAESYYNRVLGSARGQAYSSTAGMEGEKTTRIAEATGRAQAFRDVQAAYKRHPSVTRVRMYLDAAAENLARAKVIVPLADLPLDLWLMQGALPWREPGTDTDASPRTRPSPAGEGPLPTPQAESPEQPTGETWREKMQRLQETPR